VPSTTVPFLISTSYDIKKSPSFSDGSTNDPASTADDSGWNTTHYPSSGTSNKLTGVQFNVSTLGYSNIVVRWDQRVSSTGSKYYRLQYTTDGANFADFSTPVTIAVGASATTYYEAQTNNLTAISGANDNPNFAIRIVSEAQYASWLAEAGFRDVRNVLLPGSTGPRVGLRC
jgi:hypothetical protein